MMVHPCRKLIFLRWMICLLIVLPGLSWIYYKLPRHIYVSLPSIKKYKDITAHIPPPSERNILARAVNILKKNTNNYFSITYADLKPSLFLSKKEKNPSPILHITMIFLGKSARYVMIGNNIYKEGEILPDGRKIIHISERGVLVSSRGNVYLIPWQETGYVRLERSSASPKEKKVSPKNAPVPEEGELKQELAIIRKLMVNKPGTVIETIKSLTPSEKRILP